MSRRKRGLLWAGLLALLAVLSMAAAAWVTPRPPRDELPGPGSIIQYPDGRVVIWNAAPLQYQGPVLDALSWRRRRWLGR